jgi:hypothetical protein
MTTQKQKNKKNDDWKKYLKIYKDNNTSEEIIFDALILLILIVNFFNQTLFISIIFVYLLYRAFKTFRKRK